MDVSEWVMGYEDLVLKKQIGSGQGGIVLLACLKRERAEDGPEPNVEGGCVLPAAEGAAFSQLLKGAVFSQLLKGAAFSQLLKRAAFSHLLKGAAFSQLLKGAAFSQLLKGAVLFQLQLLNGMKVSILCVALALLCVALCTLYDHLHHMQGFLLVHTHTHARTHARTHTHTHTHRAVGHCIKLQYLSSLLVSSYSCS